jgi:hypothetical protein
MDRIFVQIPSYRDPELTPTLQDLFAKAAHPERLRVAVCLQSVPGEDPEPLLCFGDNPVAYLRVDARESKGVCWARHLLQQQWAGEEYALQIDSHMRFEQNWDSALIKVFSMCPGRKSVLTSYPQQYEPPDTIPGRHIPLIVPTHFDAHGTLLFGTFAIPLSVPLEGPVPGALCGGCFLFGPAAMLADVPYDPQLYFFGEEISLSVRLWTHGWDIFHPHVPIVYHHWQRDYRRQHWDDVPEWTSMDAQSRQRVNHLLGIEAAPAAAIIDLDRHGLGELRSLAEYETFTGIDFKRRSIEHYRLLPSLPPPETLEPFRW